MISSISTKLSSLNLHEFNLPYKRALHLPSATVLDSSMKTIEEFVIQMMLTDELIGDYFNSTQAAPPYTIMEISKRLSDIKTLFSITEA
jgi:hypothetical protein